MKPSEILEKIGNEIEELKYMLMKPKRLPLYDLIERKNEIIILIDLPGFSKRDVEIEVGDSYIDIKAERKEKKEGKYLNKERNESLYRHIEIPYKLDSNNARARMKNGVLEISIPIEKQKGKKIEIE